MNSNTIPQSPSSKLYVAHSSKQKSEKKEPVKQPKTAQSSTPSSPVQSYQHTGKSYYYDSMGGGYQGL
jgi:hypothetical protein